MWELIEPCSTRISNVEGFLKDIDPTLEYDIFPIDDVYGPTIHDPNFQVCFFIFTTFLLFIQLNFTIIFVLDDYLK